MKRTSNHISLSFTPQALLYPLILATSFLFAQGLKMPISYTVFVFVLLFPIISVIQLLVAVFSLKVTFRASEATVKKHRPFVVNVIIKNRFILPYSLVEARIILPEKYGEKTDICRFVFSLLPFSSCRIDRSVEFAFLGEKQIGVDSLYVYDFMHAVRLRIPVNRFADIFVLPRTLPLAIKQNADFGSNVSSVKSSVKGNDNTEPDDIRTYRVGDNPKAVHWKLSSKSEELLVKEYADDSAGQAAVLCAVEPFMYFNERSDSPRTVRAEYDETVDYYCKDLAVELALAAVRRELTVNSGVILAWMENGEPNVVCIHGESDIDCVYRRFASVSVCTDDRQFIKLAEAVSLGSCSSLTLIGPNLDDRHAEDCMHTAEILCPQTQPELHLCAADCMFENGDAEELLDGRITRLENSGFSVVRIKQN